MLAPPRRPALRQPTRATRSLDQIVWTEVFAARGSGADSTRTRSAARRARAAAHETARTDGAARSGARGQEHRAGPDRYQEDLLSLEQLRERMPSLRQREQALRAERQSIADQTRERTTYLRLADTLSAFLARVRVAADTLDSRATTPRAPAHQGGTVGDDTIVIRHASRSIDTAGRQRFPPPIRSDEPGVRRITFCVREWLVRC